MAFNLINTPIVPLVKCSILLLLLKVARVITPLRRLIYVILGFVVLTCLGPELAMIFLCPVGIETDTVYGGVKCIPYHGGGIIIMFLLAVTLFTDLLIFPIPILLLYNIKNTSFRSRLTVLCSFGLSLG